MSISPFLCHYTQTAPQPYIDIDCHFIKEKIQDGLIVTTYLASSDQPANVFSKALGRGLHAHLMSKLRMKNIFISLSLKEGVKVLSKCISVP